MSTAEPVTFLGHPVADWIERLSDSDPLLRRVAAHALGMIGPQAREARDALTAALQDEQGFVRVWAAAALAQVDRKKGSAAVRALLAGLEDAQYFVRSLAAWRPGPLD